MMPHGLMQGLSSCELLFRIYIPALVMAMADSIPIPLVPAFLLEDLKEEVGWTGVVVSMAGFGGMALSVPGGMATSRFLTRPFTL